MTAKRVPVVEGLFAETAEGARLLGSRCVTCGTPYFPRSTLCHNPACDTSSMEDASFGPRGKLWSCAIQNYPPPAPAKYDEPYTPYALGVVDLDEGLRVVGRVDTDDPEGVQLGVDVELIIDGICHDEGGNELVTWKFRPV